MKPCFFFGSTFFLCLFISASCCGQESMLKSQKNLNAWHTVSMAFKNGNPDAIENVISDDYLDHTAKGDVRGKESVKANIARLYSRFKNIKMETIKEFADNDYGFFWMRFSGEINNGPGKPSTPYDNTELQIVKFKDGKAIEHWSFIDQQNFMRMMPNNTNSKNTESNSKK